MFYVLGLVEPACFNYRVLNFSLKLQDYILCHVSVYVGT